MKMEESGFRRIPPFSHTIVHNMAFIRTYGHSKFFLELLHEIMFIPKSGKIAYFLYRILPVDTQGCRVLKPEIHKVNHRGYSTFLFKPLAHMGMANI